MKNRIAALLLATSGLACAAGALAGPMPKAEYDGAKKDIESDYRTSKIGCEPMPKGVKEACLVEVNERHEVVLAELEYAYAPSAKSQYELRILKAHAAYSVAKKKCDDKVDIARRTCLEESEATSTAARTTAAAQLKTAEGNDAAKPRAKSE